jgi:hypothetical protein
MPYQSPPSVCMPGAEAIQHIQIVDAIGPEKAIEKLRQALAKGDVGARFTSMRRVPMGASPLQAPSDYVPWPSLWLQAEISADGYVKFEDQQPRAFEVIRSQVLQHWPLAVADTADSAQASAPPKRVTRRRYPTDTPLIAEAIGALEAKRVSNVHQAAKLVYERAEGSSPAQKLDRLRKLIRDEYSNSQKPPKIANHSQ